MISRVLVPMDDSETAVRTVRYALEAYSDVEITALQVVGSPSPMTKESGESRAGRRY